MDVFHVLPLICVKKYRLRKAITMGIILILYSTKDGHTLEICQRLRQVLEKHAHQITLLSIDENRSMDLGAFDKIVIGSSVRYGKHSPQVFDFIKENSITIESKPNAFFSVNLVARKAEKNQPHTNPYLQKFLGQISWKPKNLAVFAGKIDYQRYRFWDRLIIRLIMWMTKGPTDPKSTIEYTNWKQVEDFGKLIGTMK